MTLIVGGREMVRGVDISNWQNKRGPINYGQVAQSQDFLVAKATEGIGFKDIYYRANRDGWLATGKPFSAYHWLKPNSGWQVQADYFLNYINNGEGCTWLTLDAEEAGITDDQIVNWCRYVRDRTGLPVVIYCGAYSDPKVRSAGWKEFTPWLASYTAGYTVNPDPTKIRVPAGPNPWGFWTIWQYTSSGTVPGLIGAIDCNVADAAWFDRITNNASEEDDMPTPPYIQRTSDNTPWLIYPDAGIRYNLSTLDGTTGESHVAAFKFVGIVERPKIEDPNGDFFILRSSSEPFSIQASRVFLTILLDEIKKIEPGTDIDYDAVGQAALEAFKAQINK